MKAANVDVEPYWPGLFAKALEGVNVKDLITNIGSGVGAAPAAGAAAPAAAAAAAPAAKKEEEKKEESEEGSDDDMGFGKFRYNLKRVWRYFNLYFLEFQVFSNKHNQHSNFCIFWYSFNVRIKSI